MKLRDKEAVADPVTSYQYMPAGSLEKNVHLLKI
jgi:hypothetical protein